MPQPAQRLLGSCPCDELPAPAWPADCLRDRLTLSPAHTPSVGCAFFDFEGASGLLPLGLVPVQKLGWGEWVEGRGGAWSLPALARTVRWAGPPWPGSEPREPGRGCPLTHLKPSAEQGLCLCFPQLCGALKLLGSTPHPRELTPALYCPPAGTCGACRHVPVGLGTRRSGSGRGCSNMEPEPRCLDIRSLPCVSWSGSPGVAYSDPLACFSCVLSPAPGGLGPKSLHSPLGAVREALWGPGGQHSSSVPWPCSHLRAWGLSSQTPT